MHNNCTCLYQHVNSAFKRQKFKWTFGIKQLVSGTVDKLSLFFTIILSMPFFQKRYVCWYDLICVCICIYVCISVSIYLYTSRERNQLLKCPEPLLFPWNDPWIHDSLEWRLHLLKGPSSLKKCSCVCGWVAFSVGLLPTDSWKMRGLLSPWIISGPFGANHKCFHWFYWCNPLKNIVYFL